VTAQAPEASLVGELLDERYVLLEVLGRGGVGVVYRERHVGLERMVAVKVLHAALVEEAGLVGRFQREAVAMSRLYHPHCVAVIDSGVYEARPYLVLEFLPGETITKLLGNGPFEPRRATHIALQLLETLEYFHGHHVIHRDLKSENVMLVESSGTQDFVKVLDFGMAKILTGPGADSQLSKIGLVPGTPSVMAPEQIYQLPPDPRIDIYATGILLYEMICGRRPFRGADAATVVKMQLAQAPKPPRELLGPDALSPELEQVIIQALEKDRIDRFGTAAEMAAALRRVPEASGFSSPGIDVADAVASGQSKSKSKSKSKRGSGGRRMLFAFAGALCALVLGGAAALWAKTAGPDHVAAAAPRPARATTAPVAVPAPAPAPAPTPPSWQGHRDRAVSYVSLGEHDDAFVEIKAALTDDAAAAAADPALVAAAVAALDGTQVAFVTGAFRSNPQLIPALLVATASGKTSALRHAALDVLHALNADSRADLVAMRILDIEQADSCGEMRAAYNELRSVKDPRVPAFKSDLRSRGKRDRHVRCLKRQLKR
jgi:serine/threonine-protein kinase